MTRILTAAVLFALTAQAPPAQPSCTAAEYHQFDFWIGDWDALPFDGSGSPARIRVDRMLGSCALREQYEDTNGLHGESFSIYDASRKLWHQTWVTDRGQLLAIEGALRAGAMELTGTDRTADGKKRTVRGIWTRVDGGVREVAVTSIDEGRTWTPWFDLVFRAHPSAIAGAAADDRETVAALDTAYQAAVKRNDAATMDRILADDFVLVTGAGKTYVKADLLDQARNKQTIYEHQEELAQTVRVWGSTAVVTAKLWIKGTSDGKPIDYALWFSDTYVRTPAGWHYIFGQASLPPASPR